jgi:hypothetical protein
MPRAGEDCQEICLGHCYCSKKASGKITSMLLILHSAGSFVILPHPFRCKSHDSVMMDNLIMDGEKVNEFVLS